MTLTYTAVLTCRSCKTTLTFTDERPDWKTYDYRVEHADECERSARFVAEHADLLWDRFGMPPEAAVEAWRAIGSPQFIRAWKREALGDLRMDRPGYELAIPEPFRYVDCPVCDAHIRQPSGG